MPETRCPFCNRLMPTVPVAIEEGWEPTYDAGDREIDDPVCPACVRTRLRWNDEFGSFQLIEDDAPAIVDVRQ